MSLRTLIRHALASSDDVAADEERTAAAHVAGCRPLGELTASARQSASGVLRSVLLRPRGTTPMVEAELYDGTGVLELVWLGRREIVGITPGRRLRVEGTVALRDGRPTMYNPRYELLAHAGE